MTTRRRTITVRVPAGVVDGQKVRLAGQGEAGLRGRPAGDLFVTVHVRPDEIFTRSGDDLEVTVPVSFGELALGGTAGHSRAIVTGLRLRVGELGRYFDAVGS